MWRNIIGFFILGLGNNYPYVIMLSAALDIVHRLEGGGTHNTNNTSESCTLLFNWTTNTSSYKPREMCQKQGTSVSNLAQSSPFDSQDWMHCIITSRPVL